MKNELPTVEVLKTVGLFGALGDEDLAFLRERLVVRGVEPGELIFREGEQGGDLYVVLDGEMEVLKRSHGGEDARMALLGPNDWFGEMSIIDIHPRSASVRAVSSAQLLALSTRALDELYRHNIKGYLIMVLNITRELSRRLRVADGILADFVSTVTSRRSPSSN
jgi:CRP-like cAMP-binding protein